jgi:hypothetical protein
VHCTPETFGIALSAGSAQLRKHARPLLDEGVNKFGHEFSTGCVLKLRVNSPVND